MDQAHAQEEVRAIRTIIESPYAGEVALNVRYLQSCLRDSLLRGEAPYASHGLYTQEGVLRDDIPQERELGICAGFAWREVADLTAFYIDRGFSPGMNRALLVCIEQGHPFEVRSILTGRSLTYQWREHTPSPSPPEGAQAP